MVERSVSILIAPSGSGVLDSDVCCVQGKRRRSGRRSVTVWINVG
jgi:hypothetical protein